MLLLLIHQKVISNTQLIINYKPTFIQMNDYVNTHLQQRKSSLANLNKNSSRQSLKIPSDFKNHPINNPRESSSPNIYKNHQVPSQRQSSKNYQKDISQTIQSIDSSLTKSRGKVQQQQNGDYIRNLYKKYLGKENKQSSQRINAYTQRKLRTTESRQILTSNTGIKDFTKRALFKDNQQQISNPHDKKMQKSRQIPLAYPEKQTNHQSFKIQITNQSRTSLKPKKQPLKKNQKQIPTQKDKNDSKKYKSKPKVQKAPNEKEYKAQTLQKSQSNRSKWPQSKSAQNQGDRRKLFTDVCVLSKQQQKVKIKEKVMEGVIHPHRESYCQFDTEQEPSNSKSSFQHVQSKQIKISKETYGQQFYNDLTSDQVVDSKVINYCNQGFFSRLDQVELFLGQQNSVLKVLKRIKRVKQLSTVNQRASSNSKERRRFIN